MQTAGPRNRRDCGRTRVHLLDCPSTQLRTILFSIAGQRNPAGAHESARHRRRGQLLAEAATETLEQTFRRTVGVGGLYPGDHTRVAIDVDHYHHRGGDVGIREQTALDLPGSIRSPRIRTWSSMRPRYSNSPSTSRTRSPVR